MGETSGGRRTASGACLKRGYAAPFLLWLVAYFAHIPSAYFICVIWVAHIGFDRLLGYLRTRLPNQYELAEVVGKWVWLDVSPTRKPGLASLLWVLGFHWNQRRGVWQQPCGKFDPLGSHPTDPRTKYRSYFPADLLPA